MALGCHKGWECKCHRGRHAIKPNPTNQQMLKKQAEILGCVPDDIEVAFNCFRELDKRAEPADVETFMFEWGDTLSDKAKQFVREAYAVARKEK
jgi:hypothetical protein